MFACLYSTSASQPALVALASSFSPLVEDTSPGVVVFSIVGLSRLIGTTGQIASAIARTGAEARIQANLAIASDPDAAVIAARHKSGLTMIPPGREAGHLSGLPIHVLGDFIADDDLRILDTLDRWGIRTLGELAALPELGFIARFGELGERLLRLARGETRRALRMREAPETYQRHADLEHPLALLEPLLFLLSSMLVELTEALARQGLATNRVTLGLRLAKRFAHERTAPDAHNTAGNNPRPAALCANNNNDKRTLEFPVPVRDPQVILKQLQFDLEAHPPQAAILGVEIHLHPAEPRALQHGLFLPQAPAPEKLSLTLARLTALVGDGNAGSPELLDTHRPDAFRMRPFSPERKLGPEKKIEMTPSYHEAGPNRPQPPTGGLSPISFSPARGQSVEKGDRQPCPHSHSDFSSKRVGLGQGSLSPFSARFAFRYSRPAPSAQVRLKADRPIAVNTREVLAAAGPWRASGDWWTASPWDREEWDVELSDGGLYRIFLLKRIFNPPRSSREWFLEGVYD